MNLNSKVVIPAVLVFIILAAGGGYFYLQSTKIAKASPAPQNEDKRLVLEVGKLMELPSEDPTIATVTDATRLKDQPFFQKAKNGDKVLIYTNAKKAILYDPQAKKIIDVAPLNIGSPSAQVSSPSAKSKSKP